MAVAWDEYTIGDGVVKVYKWIFPYTNKTLKVDKKSKYNHPHSHSWRVERKLTKTDEKTTNGRLKRWFAIFNTIMVYYYYCYRRLQYTEKTERVKEWEESSVFRVIRLVVFSYLYRVCVTHKRPKKPTNSRYQFRRQASLFLVALIHVYFSFCCCCYSFPNFVINFVDVDFEMVLSFTVAVAVVAISFMTVYLAINLLKYVQCRRRRRRRRRRCQPMLSNM